MPVSGSVQRARWDKSKALLVVVAVSPHYKLELGFICRLMYRVVAETYAAAILSSSSPIYLSIIILSASQSSSLLSTSSSSSYWTDSLFFFFFFFVVFTTRTIIKCCLHIITGWFVHSLADDVQSTQLFKSIWSSYASAIPLASIKELRPLPVPFESL